MDFNLDNYFQDRSGSSSRLPCVYYSNSYSSVDGDHGAHSPVFDSLQDLWHTQPWFLQKNRLLLALELNWI